MSPQAWSAIIAALAVIGQVINVALNLKLRNAMLESETRIMAKVEERLKEYKRADVCAAEMEPLKACPLFQQGRHAA